MWLSMRGIRVHCSIDKFAGEVVMDVERIRRCEMVWLRCGKAACLIRTNHFAAVCPVGITTPALSTVEEQTNMYMLVLCLFIMSVFEEKT